MALLYIGHFESALCLDLLDLDVHATSTRSVVIRTPIKAARVEVRLQSETDPISHCNEVRCILVRSVHYEAVGTVPVEGKSMS